MKTQITPEPVSYKTIAFLREDGTVLAITGKETTEELSPRELYCGDIIAEVEVTDTPTSFSHWYYPAGAPAGVRSAVWRYDQRIRIQRRWRVGRGGKLHALPAAS